MNGYYAASPRSAPLSSRARPWLVPPADPLERLLDLGGTKAMRVMAAAIILTFAFHGAAAVRAGYIHAEMIAWTLKLESAINHKLTQEIDVEAEAAKPPAPVIEDKPDPVTTTSKLEAPAPAAKAQHVLTQNPDNEVLNFGDNVFVSADNDHSPGGPVAGNGTNDKQAPPTRVASVGTGTAPAPPPQIMAVDLSRTAQLAGSGDWRCPFPPEADSDQVDEAAAIIQVTVGADGKAQTANILQDPGHGFGREARQCAMREAYVPALDRDGKAVASSKKFRVKFER
jgi:periplasmic protein TonB